MKCCKNCDHWGAMTNSERLLVNICQADPPRVFAQAVIAPGGAPVWLTITAWPEAREEWKCAKFTPRIALQ